MRWVATLLFAQYLFEMGLNTIVLLAGEWIQPVLWQTSTQHDLLASTKTHALVSARLFPVIAARRILDARYFNCGIIECSMYHLRSMRSSTSLLTKAYIMISAMGLLFQFGTYSLALLVMPEALSCICSLALLVLPEQNSIWVQRHIFLIDLNILSGVLGYLSLYYIVAWAARATISFINYFLHLARILWWVSKRVLSMLNSFMANLGRLSIIPKVVAYVVFIAYAGFWKGFIICIALLWHIKTAPKREFHQDKESTLDTKEKQAGKFYRCRAILASLGVLSYFSCAFRISQSSID